jgi:hypothetical protein
MAFSGRELEMGGSAQKLPLTPPVSAARGVTAMKSGKENRQRSRRARAV